uniref:Uncharacterized protein n=1 Tax=Micrurus lemniscatus lemniscatus TaxID=129467 RepID=A0A2D4H888_MICLE
MYLVQKEDYSFKKKLVIKQNTRRSHLMSDKKKYHYQYFWGQTVAALDDLYCVECFHAHTLPCMWETDCLRHAWGWLKFISPIIQMGHDGSAVKDAEFVGWKTDTPGSRPELHIMVELPSLLQLLPT